MGFGDKAFEWIKLINPIEHSKSKELADRYKVEPYVVAADIYGVGNLAGCGGWTWYTGSSGWMFTCILKYVLGIDIENGVLTFKPCVHHEWMEFDVRYKFGESFFNIKFKNQNNKNSGVSYIEVNGEKIQGNSFKFFDNRRANEIIVFM